MSDYTEFVRNNLHRFKQVEAFLLDVGPRFDLIAFLQAFDQRGLLRHAHVEVSAIQW
jgi:hypothetical protein